MTGRGVAYTQRTNTIVAIVADVEVNERTGAVRVPRVVVAHDCGIVINPDALKRVVEANVVQGLSRTIHEEVQFDKKSVRSVDWLTYPIVDITEAPTVIDVVLLDHKELPPTGAGEASMRPLAAAIGNAIFEATGRRIRRAPLNAANIKQRRSNGAQTVKRLADAGPFFCVIPPRAADRATTQRLRPRTCCPG